MQGSHLYSYLLCGILRVDSVQEGTTNLDQEADTCRLIPPEYLYGKKVITVKYIILHFKQMNQQK